MCWQETQRPPESIGALTEDLAALRRLVDAAKEYARAVRQERQGGVGLRLAVRIGNRSRAHAKLMRAVAAYERGTR